METKSINEHDYFTEITQSITPKSELKVEVNQESNRELEIVDEEFLSKSRAISTIIRYVQKQD